MANKSTLGGKAPQFGNKVSHSHRKSRRRWLVNVQTKNLYSLALGTYVKCSLPANMLRSLDRAGGLDNYLLGCTKESLDRPLRRIQELIINKQQKVAA